MRRSLPPPLRRTMGKIEPIHKGTTIPHGHRRPRRPANREPLYGTVEANSCTFQGFASFQLMLDGETNAQKFTTYGQAGLIRARAYTHCLFTHTPSKGTSDTVTFTCTLLHFFKSATKNKKKWGVRLLTYSFPCDLHGHDARPSGNAFLCRHR